MCSKPKFRLKFVLAEILVRERLSREIIIFISVRIELAGGLDYLRLKTYSWIHFTLRIANRVGLEKPVSLFAIFHFKAFAPGCPFNGLDNLDLG